MDELAKPADSVAAEVLDPILSDLLSLVHRNGFGPTVRVVHPDRGDMAGRLLRAGLPADSPFVRRSASHPIVLIHAPSRTERATLVLRQGGAVHVQPFCSTVSTPSSLLNSDLAIRFAARSRRGRSISGVDPI